MELAEFQQLLPKIPTNPTFPLLFQEFSCCFSWESLELLGEGPEKAGKNLNVLSSGAPIIPNICRDFIQCLIGFHYFCSILYFI